MSPDVVTEAPTLPMEASARTVTLDDLHLSVRFRNTLLKSLSL